MCSLHNNEHLSPIDRGKDSYIKLSPDYVSQHTRPHYVQKHSGAEVLRQGCSTNC